jgi:hypothetical protein
MVQLRIKLLKLFDDIPNDVEKRRGYLDTNIIAYLVLEMIN